MFEEFDSKYKDFCWYEITNEQSKNNLEKQAKQEIWPSSPLYAIIDKLEAVAKSERQDDVLFFEDSIGSIKCALDLGIETIGIIHKYNKDKK